MGLGSKLFNIGNIRSMTEIAKLSNKLSMHMKKRCAYCDMDMGSGDDYAVVDFVRHLNDMHAEHIAPQDIKTDEKLIKKM